MILFNIWYSFNIYLFYDLILVISFKIKGRKTAALSICSTNVYFDVDYQQEVIRSDYFPSTLVLVSQNSGVLTSYSILTAVKSK